MLLLRNFPAFYGTRMFIALFTRAPTGLYPERGQEPDYNVEISVNIALLTPRALLK
jgi:hypothetical protein